MTVGQLEGVEHRVAMSPVWLSLVDTFTGAPPDGGVEVTLARQVGTDWVPFEFPHQYKSNGDLAIVGLGRVGLGGAGTTFDVRVTTVVRGSVVVTSAGGNTVDVTVTTWDAEHPPALPVREVLRCYPAPDYRYRPGLPVHPGRVVDAAGAPVAGARVVVTETVQGSPADEEVRTDAGGRFRIPLRWSSGSTTLVADRAGATGSTTITLPADLGSGSVIQIS
jgi:hypothetical protein